MHCQYLRVSSLTLVSLDTGSLESQFDWLKELHYTILLRQGDLGEAVCSGHTVTLHVPFPFPGLHTICTVCEFGVAFTI